jgi:hypothetical protein
MQFSQEHERRNHAILGAAAIAGNVLVYFLLLRR